MAFRQSKSNRRILQNVCFMIPIPYYWPITNHTCQPRNSMQSDFQDTSLLNNVIFQTQPILIIWSINASLTELRISDVSPPHLFSCYFNFFSLKSQNTWSKWHFHLCNKASPTKCYQFTHVFTTTTFPIYGNYLRFSSFSSQEKPQILKNISS